MTTTINYSAHVVESMKRDVVDMLRQQHPRDAAALLDWCKQIIGAIKYQLPPMGQYISRAKPLPLGIMPQRMPFPAVSLEVPFSDSADDTIRKDGLLVSTRRHILAREARPKDPAKPLAGGYVFGREGATGVHIQISAWLDEQRHWVPMPYGCFLPYDEPAVQTSPHSRDGRMYAFNTVPEVMPDYHELLVQENGYAAVSSDNGVDVADEVKIVVEFLQVLACRNVHQRILQPEDALNRQRAKKGKTPFDVVRMLTVGDVVIGGTVSAYADDGGYKVREHMRTGHIRRLADHQVWVSDCIVAAGSPLGRVNKSYAIA